MVEENKKVEERFRVEEGWEEIPDEDDFWCPCDKGDWIAGIYTKKEEDVGRNHANVYTLSNTEGEHRIFGTVGLNKKMDGIPIGEYEVGIIYQGEKPSQPPKKPFKLFQVHKRKLDATDGATPPAPSGELKSPGKAELADADDSDAQNTIENYEDIYKSNNFGEKPTAQDIINLAETDPDLDQVDLSRVKAQLARNIKKVGAV